MRLNDAGGELVLVAQLALLDPRQQADRADGVLVDRIMVVHVELHLRDDAAEIGHEAAEHAGLVHPAQHRLGIVLGWSADRGTGRWRADPSRTSASTSLA